MPARFDLKDTQFNLRNIFNVHNLYEKNIKIRLGQRRNFLMAFKTLITS